MLKRLLSGSLQEGETQSTDSVEKECLICYTGSFESMDGPVEVNAEQLANIAVNYNARLAQSKQLNNGQVADKHCAPVQLDHSNSATVTIGRVKGELSVRPTKLLDGTEVVGLFGKCTIIGKDNVEKVLDGRWTNLSIGADFEKGLLTELTVTPFPAAAEAAMLSKKGLMSIKHYNYRGYKYNAENMGSHWIATSPLFDTIKADNERALIGLVQRMIDELLEKKEAEKQKNTQTRKMSGDKMKLGQWRSDVSYKIVNDKGRYWIYYQASKPGPYGKGTWLPAGSNSFETKEEAEQYKKQQIKLSSGEKTMNRYQKCKMKLKAMGLTDEQIAKKMQKMSDSQIDHLANMPDDEELESEDGKEKLADKEEKKELSEEKEDKKLAEEKEDDKKLSDDKDADDKLSDDKDKDDKLSDDKDADDKLSEDKDADDTKMQDGEEDGEEEEVEKEIHIDIDSHKGNEAEMEGDESMNELGAEEVSPRMKHMKQLTDSGMDEHQAALTVAKMLDPEIEEAIRVHEEKMHPGEETSMADDSEEGDDGKIKVEDKGKPQEKLSNKPEIKKLMAASKQKAESARLAIAKTKITARLSALKASAKITPAEMKKIDVDELAKKSGDTIDSIFRLYEAREPVIHVGFVGTQKGINVHKLSQEIKKLEEVEMEDQAVENMPFLKKARMAKATDKPQDKTPVGALNTKAIDAQEKNLANLVEQGKLKEVKQLMSKVFNDVKSLSLSEEHEAKATGVRIKELESTINDLIQQNDEMRKLIENI